ncbi:MAG: 3-isopropylmalate dehydratase [Chloroflexi bacterium]|nr:3-isopropylmalate dehydratase [Chloroflexota bacterium]
MSKLEIIRGKVWKFGDNVSTTDITPKEMFHGIPHTTREMVFAATRPDWKNRVQPGDCIVAGENFGFGSTRTVASDVMKELRIGCIVADSMARMYFRTAISIGFPTLVCAGVSRIFSEGDELEADIARGVIRNLTTGQSLRSSPYPPYLLEILDAGGLMPLLVKKLEDLK